MRKIIKELGIVMVTVTLCFSMVGCKDDKEKKNETTTGTETTVPHTPERTVASRFLRLHSSISRFRNTDISTERMMYMELTHTPELVLLK